MDSLGSGQQVTLKVLREIIVLVTKIAELLEVARLSAKQFTVFFFPSFCSHSNSMQLELFLSLSPLLFKFARECLRLPERDWQRNEEKASPPLHRGTVMLNAFPSVSSPR